MWGGGLGGLGSSGKAQRSAISGGGSAWQSYVITHPPVDQLIHATDVAFVIIPPDIIEDSRLQMLDMLLPKAKSAAGVKRMPPTPERKPPAGINDGGRRSGRHADDPAEDIDTDGFFVSPSALPA